MYDFWGSVIVLPFLVGTFFYNRTWIYSTVLAMLVALTLTPFWRFALKIPGDFSPGLFGFLVAVVTLLVTYPVTRHCPLVGMFTPGDAAPGKQRMDP